jgi:hypothetical protein
VRIADVILRQGHLSEDALLDTVMGGEPHAHLAVCQTCSRKAEELRGWLDETRTSALAAADSVFPPEKLALQQAQIMRRIEQVDEPARVIAFPSQAVPAGRQESGRRIAPGWLGVAAAAGLVVGVISGQMSARVSVAQPPNAAAPVVEPAAPLAPSVVPGAVDPVNASILNLDLDRHVPASLRAMDEITPTMVAQSR